MNDKIEFLKTRRSIRKYQEKQITDKELETILDVGTYAPTAMGKQAPIIVAVQDKETRDLLSKLNAAVMNGKADPFYGAPTVIVVFGKGDSGCCIQDASCVMSNLLNAAHALGLGSCWINRAKEMFETPEGKELMKKWGIPDNYEGVANCIVGYIDGEIPEPKPRKEGYIHIVK